ncbi:ATP-binding cassette sub-family A member 2-like [Glandiceps talaboti]
MAHVMKRLVDGELKFGYVPKTEAVEELITKIESDVAGQFIDFFENWLTKSKEIKHLLKSGNLEKSYYSMKTIQSSYMGNPERFKKIMKNIDVSFLTSNPTPLPEYWQLKQGIDYLDGMACLFLSQLKSKNKRHIFQAFSDEASAFDYVMKDESHQMVAVLVFTVDNEGRLPKHATYKIRDTSVFNTRAIRSRFWTPQQRCNDYYGSGFLWLQDVVDRALMKKMTGKYIQLPGSYVKRFPNQQYKDDVYVIKLWFIFLSQNGKDEYFNEDEFRLSVPLIRCKNITKVYNGVRDFALKNVSIDFYQGEITTVLGCNGAGKSTAISILANIISPTSGEVFIDGRNKTRGVIGFCPQRNSLHESMTVEEHLWFYSRLGGSSAEEAKRQVQEILLNMPLANKRQSRVSELSGGMKRMLSVAIAFIGKPSIVILDEPTASVDPYAKRKIWDLINKHRKDCTTILTTHCMQEAELLGDKIAILVDGTLQCHGSMNYLLNQLGYDYKLTLYPKNVLNTSGAPTDTQIKNDIVYLDRMSSFDTVVDIIHQELKDAKCELRTKELTVFRLSNEDVTDVDFQFDRVMELLLEIKDEYGIADFNFHAASLEDVFLTVTKGSLDIFNGKQYGTAKKMLVEVDALEFGAIRKGTGLYEKADAIYERQCDILCCTSVLEKLRFRLRWCRLFYFVWKFIITLSSPILVIMAKVVSFTASSMTALKCTSPSCGIEQFTGLILKRFIHFIRNKKMMFARIILLPALLVLILTDAIYLGELEPLPPLVLSASRYQKEYLYVPYANEVRGSMGHDSIQRIIDTFWLPAGLGSSHVGPLREGKITSATDEARHKYNTINTNPADHQRSNGKLLPSYHVTSGERLEDISGTNMTNYILSTYNAYKNNRYMALTFHGDSSDELIAQTWYSGETYHGAPFALNVLNNAILRAHIDDKIHGDPSTYGITTISHPIDKTMIPTLIAYRRTGDIMNGGIAFTFIISLLVSSVVINVIFEKTNNIDHTRYPSNIELIPTMLKVMFIEGIIAIVILMIYEYWPLNYRMKKDVIDSDFDVRLKQSSGENKSLIVRNITKIYRPRRNVDFVAANCVSFYVQRGECLGLIGHNGSGKTTTLEMVTGFTSVTSGEIYINSDRTRDVEVLYRLNNHSHIRQRMGYCPQFDALFEELTPKEHFTFYGKLQNIPKNAVKTVIKSTLNEFYLQDEADKPVKYLSGGNRRKLTAALAFYGDKSIVILDEVTNNMDPWNQRMMWNIIKKKKAAGVSIIMTTHSLGECERLCDRLVMLKNGVINRQGSLQEFKHNFNGKFIVDIFSSEAKLPMLYTLLNESFQPKVYQIRPTDPVQLEVDSSVVNFEELRKRLQNMARTGVIEDFTFQEHSLEEAFIQLQEDEYIESIKKYKKI